MYEFDRFGTNCRIEILRLHMFCSKLRTVRPNVQMSAQHVKRHRGWKKTSYRNKMIMFNLVFWMDGLFISWWLNVSHETAHWDPESFAWMIYIAYIYIYLSIYLLCILVYCIVSNTCLPFCRHTIPSYVPSTLGFPDRECLPLRSLHTEGVGWWEVWGGDGVLDFRGGWVGGGNNVLSTCPWCKVLSLLLQLATFWFYTLSLLL